MGGAFKCAAAAYRCRLPACQTKAAIRSKLSARSMQIYAQTFATDLCLDLYRTLTSAQKARLLRGEVDPWETSPLNNSPLLTGLEKRYCQKCCFPIGISPLLVRKCHFPIPPEVSRHATAPRIGGPRGNPKSIKKRSGKQDLKKRCQKRPLGPHGEPRGAPGRPNEAKIGAKRLPKRLQKRCFLGFSWENGKYDENILFATL
jgi:hypothetical protein